VAGAIDGVRRAIDIAAAARTERISADQDRAAADDTPETGAFHGLFQRHSSLERLIADAGPLGKFKTDQPDQMPSGTSAFTLRVGDALNRIAARLGLPVERILSGNPALTPAMLQRLIAELPPGHGPSAAQADQRATDPRPAVAVETDNHMRGTDRGNTSPAKA